MCWINVFVYCTGSNLGSTEIVDCMFLNNKTSIWLFCSIENIVDDCKTELLTNNYQTLNVKELKIIYCTGSYLNTFPFMHRFQHLEKLDVSSYEFTNFTISEENFSLKILIASNNRLTDLRQNYLQPMIALAEVDFSRNNISFVEKFISKKLKLINLSHNNISKLSDDTFLELHELSNLDMSFNRIETISDNLFVNNRNLEILSLQNNRIKHFGYRASLENIYTLNVANNQQMDVLELLKHLRMDRLW